MAGFAIYALRESFKIKPTCNGQFEMAKKKTQSMIDKHVIDEMWEFLYTVVSSNHSKYTSQRITDLNPLGSSEFGHDSDGLKPMVKKTTKTKQKSQQHIQDYTGTVHFDSFRRCCLWIESDWKSISYLKLEKIVNEHEKSVFERENKVTGTNAINRGK